MQWRKEISLKASFGFECQQSEG